VLSSVTQECRQLETCGFHQSIEKTSGRIFLRLYIGAIISKPIIFAEHSKKCMKVSCRSNAALAKNYDFVG
jgi:hypothetical protein